MKHNHSTPCDNLHDDHATTKSASPTIQKANPSIISTPLTKPPTTSPQPNNTQSTSISVYATVQPSPPKHATSNIPKHPQQHIPQGINSMQ